MKEYAKRTIRINKELNSELENYSLEKGESGNQTIEKAIRFYLNRDLDITTDIIASLEGLKMQLRKIENIVNLEVINQNAQMDWIMPSFWRIATEVHNVSAANGPIEQQIKTVLDYYHKGHKIFQEYKSEKYGMYRKAIEVGLANSLIIEKVQSSNSSDIGG